MQNKLSGSFYTPEGVASWMSKRVLTQLPKNISSFQILEPSCGDGVFLKALNNLSPKLKIDAVELNSEAIEIAKISAPNTHFYNQDFLFWQPTTNYDAVIGNPPYIVKKSLAAEQAEQCKNIHAEAGMASREVANIWTSFVLKCAQTLSPAGILAFVLPTELLQVNYSQEIRAFLLKHFKRVEVISFRNLAFDKLDQDTVIIFAYKKSENAGLFFTEVSSIEELSQENFTFIENNISESSKWSSYILNELDIHFISEILKKCSKISDYCTSAAGIVTAANSYFIVSQKEVDKYSLQPYIKPIIQKGMYVNGSAEVTEGDYEKLKLSGKPCYLIDLNNVKESDFSTSLIEYLALGKQQDIPNRYKCLQRDRWYDIPSIWKSEGFFFKRGHNYPKLLVNDANVYVTDSAYRVKMHTGYEIKDFTMSFYNSLTLLCSELFGRYYGGGVLELTPNEFKRLPLPYAASSSSYEDFINDFEEKDNIESFLQKNDKIILESGLGLTNQEVARIHHMYQLVRNRRLRKEA